MKIKALIIIILCFVSSFYSQAQDTVVFSTSGGFYDNVFALQLDCQNPQNHIRYTTNGNRPTAQSPLYEEPLTLNEHLYSKSDIYTIVNCPDPDFFLPDSVRHCIIIRAAVFDESDSCVSAVTTNSYFIHAIGCNTHGLPAISLCADSLDLYDYETGIFVPGIHFDSLEPYFTGNYFMKGREWERLCNVEFYELNDNSGINQQLGLRTHGKQSRWRSQKGLSLYAREEYGKKRIKYKFFDEIPMEKFKRLSLRPFASAWNGSGSKDYICNRIAQHLDVEFTASRPAVLFINGEYFGIYYVQEKPDEHYLEDHFDIDEEEINLIKDWITIDYGSANNYNALYNWMLQADLSDDEQYAYATEHIDIDNFIDYYVFELFAANVDWPSTNTRFWQHLDGKWRWIFFDGDACLEVQNFDVFANATYEGDDTYPSSRKATLFFRRLLENDHFKVQFSSRFNQLVHSTLSYQNTKPYFDYIKATLTNEVPNQSHRFGSPSAYSTWLYYSMRVINEFLMERPETILDALNGFLSIGQATLLGFHCYPNPFSSELHINIDTDTFGTNEIYIYDMMGRKVFAMPCMLYNGSNEITLNLDLKAGVYILKVGNHAQRIVKY